MKSTFDDLVGYGKALFGRCEAALFFVPIVEVVDYQSKCCLLYTSDAADEAGMV